MIKKLLFIPLAASLFLASCGFKEKADSERGRGDAERFPSERIDGRTADGITEFPDGFGNVATKCVWNGWRAFIATKASSGVFIVRDESCRYEETGPEA